MNLFVDCTGTLLLPDKGQWNWNDALIQAIMKFQDANPEATVKVWTFNGVDFADQVARSVGKGWGTDKKAIDTPQVGDVVIDDRPFDFDHPIFAAEVMTPEAFVEKWS